MVKDGGNVQGCCLNELFKAEKLTERVLKCLHCNVCCEIVVRVDGFLFNLHSINAGVPQGSVISPVLLLLFINHLLTSVASSIHSFADDTFLSSSFSFNPNDHASTDIQLHRNISASLLSNDLTVIEKWGKDNVVSFNQSKMKQAVIHANLIKTFHLSL